MSYHIDHLPGAGRPAQRTTAAPAYAYYPLAMAAPPEPPPAQGMDPILKVVLLVIAIALVIYLIDQMLGDAEPEAPRRNPGKKMSTRDMARTLYERLEKNGAKVNETTLRSLAQIGRKAP